MEVPFISNCTAPLICDRSYQNAWCYSRDFSKGSRASFKCFLCIGQLIEMNGLPCKSRVELQVHSEEIGAEEIGHTYIKTGVLYIPVLYLTPNLV